MEPKYTVLNPFIINILNLVHDKPSTSQTSESSKTQGTTKVITNFQNKVLSQINSVFAEDDPDEDHTHVIKKKIKPFEITAQVSFTFLNIIHCLFRIESSR